MCVRVHTCCCCRSVSGTAPPDKQQTNADDFSHAPCPSPRLRPLQPPPPPPPPRARPYSPGTKYKRAACKNTGSPLKTVKDVEKFIAELKPDAPLKSVSFNGNEPPSVNNYNVILAGPFKLDAPCPPGRSPTHGSTPLTPQVMGHCRRRRLHASTRVFRRRLSTHQRNVRPYRARSCSSIPLQ